MREDVLIDTKKIIQIKCTAKSEKEKQDIKAIFKKNHVSMAGFVMDCLRQKAKELKK